VLTLMNTMLVGVRTSIMPTCCAPARPPRWSRIG
jgi:hypothetical protein